MHRNGLAIDYTLERYQFGRHRHSECRQPGQLAVRSHYEIPLLRANVYELIENELQETCNSGLKFGKDLNKKTFKFAIYVCAGAKLILVDNYDIKNEQRSISEIMRITRILMYNREE